MGASGGTRRTWIALLPPLLLLLGAAPVSSIVAGPSKSALLSAEEATDAKLDELAKEGYGTIALPVAPAFVTVVAEQLPGGDWVKLALDSHGSFTELFVHSDVHLGARACRLCFGFRDGLIAAAKRVRAHQLKLAWWCEVGRQPAIADALPELQASLQGHENWRRRFRDAPHDDAEHVLKCWPWIPATTIEGRTLHAAWLCGLARILPPADALFLNDLQGGPSACGCGNLQCRWTSDYGDKRTTTPAGDDAAAGLLGAIREAFGASTPVIPVWTTECEGDDVSLEGHCGGVSCYGGACWREMWNQLDPVAASSTSVGVLLLAKSFERSGADDRGGAAWIAPAIAALGAADDRRAGPPLPASRVVAVLESAGRDRAIVAAELAAAEAAGVAGVVVALAPLAQSFEPRSVPFHP